MISSLLTKLVNSWRERTEKVFTHSEKNNDEMKRKGKEWDEMGMNEYLNEKKFLRIRDFVMQP